MKGGLHLRELDELEYVCELLSERFDNAVELMTPESIIYGGAPRDCVAGKELLGDLDIAVSKKYFSQMYSNFANNPRWVLTESGEDSVTVESKGQYSSGPKTPLSGMVSFTGVNGQIVQIMTPNQQTKDGFMDALTLSQTVDMCCCGIVILPDGRVFETIVGAYEDCINGVLRLNEESGHIVAKSTNKRIKRLVDRGWKDEINRGHLKRCVSKFDERTPEIEAKKKGTKLSDAFFIWKML